MRFKKFRQLMKKEVFSMAEAQVIAFDTSLPVLRLELHKWVKGGDLISIKRGVYAFSNIKPAIPEVAKALYYPCYISLETALNFYGLLPDIIFGITLVTTKATRKFNTPFGQFSYQQIKKEAFMGFDPKTLTAEPEKGLVDYLYLNRNKFAAKIDFWDELRLQNLNEISFSKAFSYAEKFKTKKLTILLRSLKEYAKSTKTR